MSTFNRSGVSHVAGAALLGPRANAYTWLLAGASKLRPRQRCVWGGQVCKATLACSGSLMLQGTAFHPVWTRAEQPSANADQIPGSPGR